MRAGRPRSSSQGILLACGCFCGRLRRRSGDRVLWRVEKAALRQPDPRRGPAAGRHHREAAVVPVADQLLRLAWLADDGQPVAAGEVVARFDRQPIEKQLERRPARPAQGRARWPQRAERQDRAKRGDLETSQATAELELGFSRAVPAKRTSRSSPAR